MGDQNQVRLYKSLILSARLSACVVEKDHGGAPPLSHITMKAALSGPLYVKNRGPLTRTTIAFCDQKKIYPLLYEDYRLPSKNRRFDLSGSNIKRGVTEKP